MITIQQARYILTVADLQHFQRASEQCFVSQPTLSMQIKKAEDELGYLIFDRSTTPLTPTPFGEKLIPLLRELIHDMDKIGNLTKIMSGTYTERIRLAVIPTVSGYLIPDLFDQWQQALPNIQLSIREMKSEEILQALDKKEIDLGIMAGPHHDVSLRTLPLFREEIKAYLPVSEKEFISTSELETQHPWLLSQGNCLRTQMVHFCGLKSETEERWNYEGGNLEMLLRMVDSKGGYSLVPEEYQRILRVEPDKCKRIVSSETGEIPLREIIALVPNRTTKWESIEKMIRLIQLQYGKSNEQGKFQVLKWK